MSKHKDLIEFLQRNPDAVIETIIRNNPISDEVYIRVVFYPIDENGLPTTLKEDPIYYMFTHNSVKGKNA